MSLEDDHFGRDQRRSVASVSGLAPHWFACWAATVMRLPLALLVLTFAVALTDTSKASRTPLKCYQCSVEENALCTDEYLLPCPDDQAYDSCMTTMSKSKDTGFLITKRCALAPCTMRDPKQSSGLGMDHCDRSREEYNCVECCRGDGCNTNGVSSAHPIKAVLTLMTVVVWRRL